MRFFVLFLTFLVLSANGCTENKQTSNNLDVKESICIPNYDNTTEITENTSDNVEKDMFDIFEYFSSEELDQIRNNFVRELSFIYWKEKTIGQLRVMEDDNVDVGNRNQEPDNLNITEEEKSDNMETIYRILSKKYSFLKPVSQTLFKEKMESVFNIDVEDKSIATSLFYTNQKIYEVSHYSVYIDKKNRLLTLGCLPFNFKEDIDWEKLVESFEKKGIAYNSIEAFDARQKYHNDYLTKAIQEKYAMYCSKSSLEYLFHCNNYVFYDNKASLSWLLTHDEGKSFLTTLFNFFNYDQEPRINKYMFDIFFANNDVSKGYPLRTPDYENIFGELQQCDQINLYNHFQFKVRTGLMQYVVDNCYDDTDLDDCGLKKDKYICVMEDCFDYLFKKVLEGDKYKESQNCHYYQTCAYLAYYLQKAYDNYVSHGDGQPRCWHNALVNNLYEDIRNNESRFENYVKENNYFDLDGFEEIMKDAHGQAMRE